jgi:predicted O-methyltransferase YrrM
MFLVGLRDAKTSDTADELLLLGNLAHGKKIIIEIGVFEGVASKVFCKNMKPDGKLYLVDPYFKALRIEKLFNFSTTEYIAQKNLTGFKDKARFIKKTSAEAVQTLSSEGKAEFIFIDARHDYDSVLQDFKLWSRHLVDDGLLAFHDSHICDARPDLNLEVGPVKLCQEIASGLHGPWKILKAVDSITVVSKK